jgi:hypothetical protein
MYATGSHIFKGVAKLNGVNVSISPEYKTEVITSVVGDKELPAEFKLYQNYPNPFNPETTISYVIPSSNRSPQNENVNVTLKVYDLLGREVTTLVNETQPPGIYNVKFSMNNISKHSSLDTFTRLWRASSSLSSAIYFYTLKTGNYSQTKKMVLVR